MMLLLLCLKKIIVSWNVDYNFPCNSLVFRIIYSKLLKLQEPRETKLSKTILYKLGLYKTNIKARILFGWIKVSS